MRILKILILSLICLILAVGCYGLSEEDTLVEQSAVEDPFVAAELACEQEMLDIALSYEPLYEQMMSRPSDSGSISEEDVAEIVRHIAGQGYTVTAFDHNMENHQPFDDFLMKVQEGSDASSYYYQVGNNGGFSRMDYQHEDGRLYITVSSLVWDEEGNPIVKYFTNLHIVEKWSYTEKGYLIYSTTSNPNSYALLRVRPLEENERNLCKAYIAPIGYQGNNLFLVDWDQDDLSPVAFNDLYDTLFALDTGENTKYDMSTGSIPAAEFEPLYEKYFGVTPAFLRENAVYYADDQSYFWNYLTCSKHYVWGHAPSPEVVDSWENEDGTITMVVDALDDYKGNDRAFTHEVTVREREDGSFMYVSNRVWPEDKPRVPSYTPRSEPII